MNAMIIVRIDEEEIIGLKCPKTGACIYWDDEDIIDVLPGTVVAAVVSSLCPEECAFAGMPLGEAWKLHYRNVKVRKLGLDEIILAFPASGKALKIVHSGISCGPVHDVAYYLVPATLEEECFIRADFEGGS